MRNSLYILRTFFVATVLLFSYCRASASDVTMTMQPVVTNASGTLYLDVALYIQTTGTSYDLGASSFVIDFNTSALSYSSVISTGSAFNSGDYTAISSASYGSARSIEVTYNSGTGTVPGSSAPGSLIGTLRFLITDRSAKPNLTWQDDITGNSAVWSDGGTGLSQITATTWTNPTNKIMGPMPSLDAKFVLVTNNGTNYSAKIQVQSTTPNQHLGSATFKLTYNSSDITFSASPSSGTDFSFSNFSGGNYATGAVTRPSLGNITVTISLTGGTGTGTSISSGYVDVVTLNFSTTNALGNSSLAWNMTTTSTSTYNNASVFELNNVANDSSVIFQQGTFAGLNTNPLPVTLTNFYAKMVNGSAQLQWSTATEQNNSYFTIERSADGKEFMPLFTKTGFGNSNTKIDYTAYDDNPLDGISYYRLKQTDYNGKSETFYMVSLDNEDMSSFTIRNISLGDNSLVNYVMPANGIVEVRVTSANGIVIKDYRIAAAKGDNRFSIDNIQSWKPGMYVVNMEYNGKSVSSKMIKN
jgi:hypothetical protein